MSLFDWGREHWEQDGYRVVEHTDARPVDWGRVDSVVVHYTADKTIPDHVAGYIAAMQRSYVNGRGYSLGYSCAIDKRGKCWEIRGVDHIPAATKNENGHTFAVLMLVDWQNPANDLQVARMRRLVADILQHTSVTVTGHRDWGATRCPGDGVYGQLAQFAESPAPVPKPEQPTVDIHYSKDYEMKIVTPVRVYDSRHMGAHSKSETRRVRVTSCEAAFVNITAVDPAGDGWITVWSGTTIVPNVSNVNFVKGQTIANSAWVPVTNGQIDIFTSAPCHVLVDLQAVV